MVKPMDHDVVFLEMDTSAKSNDNGDINSKGSIHGPQTPTGTAVIATATTPSTPSSAETTGNTILRGLLQEYYQDYFDAEDNPREQESVRKQLLDRFHEAAAARAATVVPSGPGQPPTKSPTKFLVHRKQGTSFSFYQVMFKNNIDQKIKESFERLRRDKQGGIDNPTNDRMPVGLSPAKPSTTKATSLFGFGLEFLTRHRTSPTAKSSSPVTKKGSEELPTKDPKKGSEEVSTKDATSSAPSKKPEEDSKEIWKETRQQEDENDDDANKADASRAVAAAGVINREHDAEDVSMASARSSESANNGNIENDEGDEAEPSAAAPNADSNEGQQQAAGCGTGEEGQKTSPPRHNANEVSARSHSNTTARAGGKIYGLRKRARNFLWKNDDDSDDAKQQSKRQKADAQTTTPAVSANNSESLATNSITAPVTTLQQQSSWGKLRNMFFGTNPPKEAVSMPTNDLQGEDPSQDTKGLRPMEQITVSPYEGNQSAEVGEALLDEWKNLMKPLNNTSTNGDDANGSSNNSTEGAMNPLLSKLYGDPMASTIFRARLEIAKLSSIYETRWKYGKIGALQLGWIPKRQLLLCLDEDKLGHAALAATTSATPRSASANPGGKKRKEDSGTSGSEDEEDEEDEGDENEGLQKVARKLECFELVIACIRTWKLKFDYPVLYSNKEYFEFVFPNCTEETKLHCCKCQIFVARVFATLLLLQKDAEAPPPTLLAKVRACLAILNEHARPNATELTKLLRKKERLEEKAAAATHEPTTETAVATDDEESSEGKNRKKRARKQTYFRSQLIEGNCREREETLLASFALVKKESETLLQMMDYFRTRLMVEQQRVASRVKKENGQSSKSSRAPPSEPAAPPVMYAAAAEWNDEIAANLKAEVAREERRLKKVLQRRRRRASKGKKATRGQKRKRR